MLIMDNRLEIIARDLHSGFRIREFNVILWELDSRSGQYLNKGVFFSDRSGKISITYPSSRLSELVVDFEAKNYFSQLVPCTRNSSKLCIESASLEIHIPTWWASTINSAIEGQNLKIGIIDSGCVDHACLPHVEKRRLRVHTDTVSPLEFILSAGDRVGHGTHVAGIISARNTQQAGLRGFVPCADVISVGITDSAEKTPIEIAYLVAAIDYLTSRNVDIINMSLGVTCASPGEIRAVEGALRRARNADILLVAAAGNKYGPITTFPALSQNVIPVTAYGSLAAIPYYSRGSIVHNIPLSLARQDDLDLFRPPYAIDTRCLWFPGVEIISTAEHGGWRSLDGSSMASAVATGILAQVLSQDGLHVDSVFESDMVEELMIRLVPRHVQYLDVSGAGFVRSIRP